MVPTKGFPFPSIVVVVAGPTYGSDVCEYQELAVVFYNPRIPVTTLGITGYAYQFLDIGSRVFLSNLETHDAD